MSRRRPGSGRILLGRMARTVQPTDGLGRAFIVAPIVIVVLCVGAFWGWKLIRSAVLNRSEYRLDARQIVFNKPPPWITVDALRNDVIRDAGLDRPLSILDEQLTEKIALAFAAHPWVADVRRVEKFHPARVEVTLAYRHPTAAVAVDGELLPVDSEGVLLPVEDFTQLELERFPQIRGAASRPGRAAGTSWGDPRIAAAAKVAATFDDLWYTLPLEAIVPSRYAEPGRRDVYRFELITRGKARIAWGRHDPTGSGKPTAEEKLERLKDYFDRHGTLDGFRFSDLQPPQRNAKSPAGDATLE